MLLYTLTRLKLHSPPPPPSATNNPMMPNVTCITPTPRHRTLHLTPCHQKRACYIRVLRQIQHQKQQMEATKRGYKTPLLQNKHLIHKCPPFGRRSKLPRTNGNQLAGKPPEKNTAMARAQATGVVRPSKSSIGEIAISRIISCRRQQKMHQGLE